MALTLIVIFSGRTAGQRGIVTLCAPRNLSAVVSEFLVAPSPPSSIYLGPGE